jgi:Flp pilus assembly protein TadB
MSASAALILTLVAILLLGGVAAWLINMPIWLIATFLVGGGLVIRRIFSRLMARRARQDTEAPSPRA